MPDAEEAGIQVGTRAPVVLASLRGTALASIVGLAVTLVLTPVVLHSVELSVYGAWATASTVLALGALAESGITTELVRRIAAAHGAGDVEAERQAVREGTTVLALVGLLVALAGGASAPVIVDWLFGDLSPADQRVMRLVLAALFVQLGVTFALNGWFAVLRGLQRSEHFAYSRMAGLLVTLAATVVALSQGLELGALYLGNLLGAVTTWAVLARAVRQVRPGTPLRVVRMAPRQAGRYFALSLVVIAGTVSNLVDNQLDKVVLTAVEGPASAGSYHLGALLSTQAWGLALLPVGLMLAGTAELLVRAPDHLHRVERLADRGTYALVAVVLGGVVLFAPAFVPLWLGDTYADAVLATQLLALALIVGSCAAPWYYAAIGRGHYGLVALSAFANAAVNAVLSIALTLQLGLVGALVGSVAGNATGVAVLYLLLRRRSSYRPRLLRAVAAGAVTVVVAVPFWLALPVAGQVRWWHLVILAPAWLGVAGLALSSLRLSGVRLRASAPYLSVDR